MPDYFYGDAPPLGFGGSIHTTRPTPQTEEQKLEQKVRRHQQALADAEAELAALALRPKDTYPDYTVIRFTKPGRFLGSNTTVLTYAAIKAGSSEGRPRWFLTGIERQGKTWDALLSFIGDNNHDTIEVAVFLSAEVERWVAAWDKWWNGKPMMSCLDGWNEADWRAVRYGYGPDSHSAPYNQANVDQAIAIIRAR